MPHRNLKLNVLDQYKEEIERAFKDAHELGAFHPVHFNELISKVWKYAQLEGITKEEFESLLNESLPETFDGWSSLSWKNAA